MGERAEVCRELLQQSISAGNECGAETQGQHFAVPSPKPAVSAVRVRKRDHPVRTEDKSRKSPTFSFWTLSSEIMPTWHVFPTHICCLCCLLFYVNWLNDLFLFPCSHAFIISKSFLNMNMKTYCVVGEFGGLKYGGFWVFFE